MRKITILSLVTLIMVVIIGGFLVWGEAAEKPVITLANAGALKFDPAVIIIMKKFTEKFGIEVKAVEVPDEKLYVEMSKSLSLGESTYDVLNINTIYWKTDWVRAGFLEPIPNYPKEQLEAYSPGVRDALMYKGKVYVSPQWGNTRLLFYRKSYFKEAGLDPNKPPKTWDELVDYAKKLTVEKAGLGDRYGFSFAGARPEFGLEYYLQMAYSGGARMWRNGKVAINEEPGAAALQLLADMRNVHKVCPRGVVDYVEGDSWELMYTGKAAMSIDEPFVMMRTKAKFPDDVGVAMYPMRKLDDPKAGGLLVLPGWAVNAKSKNKEAAFKWCIYYGSFESQKHELIDEGNIPLHLKVFEDPDAKAKVAHLDVIVASMKRAVAEDWVRYMEVEDIMGKAIQKAELGLSTAKEALDEAAAKMKKIKR